MLVHPLLSHSRRPRGSFLGLLDESPFAAFEHFERELRRSAVAPLRTTRVERDDRGTTLVIDVPGVAPEEIDVRVEGAVVEVNAKAPTPVVEGSRALRSERARTQISERFLIDDALDASTLSASLKDGVLSLRIERKASSGPRRIPVTTQKGDRHVDA